MNRKSHPLNAGLGFACFALGWSGLLIQRRLNPDRQVRLLRKFSRLVETAMKLPVTHRVYHQFRGHGKELPEERFTPRRSPKDTDVGREDAVVLFSGGKDSTHAALDLARRFRTVHLLTLRLDNVEGIERCEINVDRLRKRLGADKFVHSYVDGNDPFFKLHFEQRKESSRLFGATVEGAACIPCRLAMECRALIYCRETGIRWACLGFNPQSRLSFNQNLRAVRMTEEFMGQYGVQLVVPLWENPETDPLEDLYQSGVIPDRQLGKTYQYGPEKITQGACPWGSGTPSTTSATSSPGAFPITSSWARDTERTWKGRPSPSCATPTASGPTARHNKKCVRKGKRGMLEKWKRDELY